MTEWRIIMPDGTERRIAIPENKTIFDDFCEFVLRLSAILDGFRFLIRTVLR